LFRSKAAVTAAWAFENVEQCLYRINVSGYLIAFSRKERKGLQPTGKNKKSPCRSRRM
jgi:hypothetical protein